MTWAPLVARLVGLCDDLPTRVAVAGLAGFVAVSVGLVWWTNHHYVRSAATDWRLTTWEQAMEAERTAGRTQDGAYVPEAASPAQLSSTMRGSNGGRGDGRHTGPG